MRLSSQKIQKLADEIRTYLIKQELWVDTTIYFNNKAYSTHNGDHYSYNDPDDLIEINNVDPRKHIEYCGKYLTMSFEGPLYDELNYGNGIVYDRLQTIFKKYGLYFELGNTWNLSAYEL